jgi:hypothetical protein
MREIVPPPAFYAEAEPCESCGQPTFLGRVWNQEHELWIAQDCSCNTPYAPSCPLLIPALESAETVNEVCQVIREHRKSCPLCGPKEITGLPVRRSVTPEGERGTGQKEAA